MSRIDPHRRARQRAETFIESRRFQWFITGVILVNAATLGLHTVPAAEHAAGPLLHVLDRIALGIFVAEIALKFWVLRGRFFRDGWNLFDFAVVAVSLIPFAGSFSVLRALRIFRVARLLSVLPRLRAVVEALLSAIPGMASIAAVLALIFYVFAVLATQFFGPDFPQWFGNIGRSAYSLFQIMTLESWSMGIVRPVMQKHPWAWAFFVPFIVITSFAVLNLFIGILVSAIQARHEGEIRSEYADQQQVARDERQDIGKQLGALRADMAAMKRVLERLERREQNQPERS